MRLAMVIAGLCASSGAMAADAGFELSAAVGRTDNLTRATTDEQDATLASAGLGFSVLHETRRVTTDLFGELQFMEYGGDEYSSEVIGNAAGRVSLGLVQDRLRWVVEDNFGQTRRDLFSVPTPDNRENVNVFSTGPDLRLQMGSATSLVIGGRYSRVDYESADASSTRAGGWIAAERELPSGALVSLNVAGEQIDPEAASGVPEYDRTLAAVRFELEGARSSVTIDVGANRVKGGGIDDTGALLRFELARRIGRLSTISLSAGQELTDAGNSMRLGEGQLSAPVVGTDSALQTAQPYTSRYAELAWTASGRFTSLGLSGGIIDEDYEGAAAPDRQLMALGLRGSRRLGARTEVSAGVAYNSSDFDVAASDNDDLTYTAAVSWRLGRRLRMEVSGEHYDYSSDVAGTDTSETRYWLRLRFGEAPARNFAP
jgi:hypothetical protein